MRAGIEDRKSRINREVHVRFCGSLGVKFPQATRLANNVPLNASNPEVRINVLDVYETRPGTKKRPKPKTTRFSWVTNLPLDEKNLMKIMRAGRSRWKIENETINTLKNQGYHFEHNYGHGYKHSRLRRFQMSENHKNPI